MIQKSEKRDRTRRYRIISKVTGSWLPLWSQGFKVCIHPPFTDEPRIALDIDDLVNVTRWRKYWLFGEKIQSDDNNAVINGKKHKNGSVEHIKVKRVRGWFPRKTAVDDNQSSDHDDDDDENSSEQKKNK